MLINEWKQGYRCANNTKHDAQIPSMFPLPTDRKKKIWEKCSWWWRWIIAQIYASVTAALLLELDETLRIWGIFPTQICVLYVVWWRFKNLNTVSRWSIDVNTIESAYQCSTEYELFSCGASTISHTNNKCLQRQPIWGLRIYMNKLS